MILIGSNMFAKLCLYTTFLIHFVHRIYLVYHYIGDYCLTNEECQMDIPHSVCQDNTRVCICADGFIKYAPDLCGPP